MTAAPRKISEMPPATVIADADLLPIVDVSESSVSSKNKKVTIAQILASLPDSAITSAKIADGAIVNADINAAAAIADTKLATIATAGKVSNSATTATNVNTASAIVARDGSGNFSAGTITAALAGNASTVTTNANLTGDVISIGNATSIAAGVVVNADVNASAGIVASKLSFTQAGTGAVVRSVDGKLKDVVSVKDFGAVGDGVADDTAAFNLATRASVAHTGNDDLSMRREIYVPPGDYRIEGTVYIRKGQLLRGAGDGATRIVTTGASTGRVVFKLGFGLPGGVETQDPGGLPAVIEKLHTFGGDTSGAFVDMRIAGAQARDLFITSAGVGIRVGGGDTIVTRCIIDQGLNGIVVDGQNHIINSCLFYDMKYGISISSNTYDVQIGDCHFEYSQFNDIIFNDAATNIKNVTISNCQFTKNVQHATSDAGINLRCNEAEIAIRGCDFRNQKGYSIARTNGLGSVVRVSDCSFDGNRTNPAYAQSTTAKGIDTTNSKFEIINCHFQNLLGEGVKVEHTFPYPVLVKNCTYVAITGASSFVSITGSTGSVVLEGNTGDNVLPLFNSQSSIAVTARLNSSWLGAAVTASSRFYWAIPTQGGAAIQVGISSCSNPAGNTAYRKVTTALITRYIDNSGSAVTDYLVKTNLYESPTSFAPALDIVAALDAVGGGSSAGYTNLGRVVVVSIPNTYTNTNITADFVA